MLERIIKFSFALLLIIPISAIVLGQTIGPPPSSGGGGAATCGSQALGVCFNSSGAFSSSSDFVVDTTNHVMTAGALSGSAYSGGFGAQSNSFANGSPSFGAFDNSTLNTGIFTDPNAAINFVTNTSPRMLLTNSDKLGLDTGNIISWGTISGVPHTISADTGLARNAAAAVEVDNGTAGTLGTIVVAHVTATTLANSATTSAVCYNTSTGVFTYDGTIGTCNTSDAKLKNIDGPIDSALQKVLAVHGIYFHYKDPEAQAVGRQIGVTAQNVETVFPELVATDSNGIKSVDYQKMVAPIIEALREQQEEIAELRRQLAIKVIRASVQ